jgi:hypothetical protein
MTIDIEQKYNSLNYGIFNGEFSEFFLYFEHLRLILVLFYIPKLLKMANKQTNEQTNKQTNKQTIKQTNKMMEEFTVFQFLLIKISNFVKYLPRSMGQQKSYMYMYSVKLQELLVAQHKKYRMVTNICYGAKG